ncbi:MAG: hypothetical protein GKR89_32770 [Candidatus Latescibacteria bacterium]|nr:hypothetical protein [Candidatus Latescibacterota bacterium]
MKIIRIKKKIPANGELALKAFPFQEDEDVVVIILSREKPPRPFSPLTYTAKC